MAEKTTWAYTPKRQGDRVALPHEQSHDSSFHLTVAAAHQHDPTTQCLGLPAPGPRGVAAPCVRMAYASANARGWSIGGQNPNLRTGVIHGGRSTSTRAELSPQGAGARTAPIANTVLRPAIRAASAAAWRLARQPLANSAMIRRRWSVGNPMRKGR